jgi:hypothetical protein
MGIGGGSSGPVVNIRASRLFAGPGQYPPREFAAYGILAFRSLATPESIDRYIAICRGYLAGIPSSASLEALGVAVREQMATIWPLADRGFAGMLNGANPSVAAGHCDRVARATDLATSLNAIQQAARTSGMGALDGRGPYLLAWSPSSSISEPDAVVLVWDLSDVTNAEQATRMFADWAVEIEQNPALWDQGWNLEKLRTRIRLWADKYGADVLQILGDLT